MPPVEQKLPTPSPITTSPLQMLTDSIDDMQASMDAVAVAVARNTEAIKAQDDMFEAMILSQKQEARATIELIAEMRNTVSGLKLDNAEQIVGTLNYLQQNVQKFLAKDTLFEVPPATVIVEQDETVKGLRDIYKAIKNSPESEKIKPTLTAIEGSLKALEALRTLEIPMDRGRVAVRLSNDDIERLKKGLEVPWQMLSTAETTEELRIANGFVTARYNEIDITYPTATTELFTYKMGGNTVTRVQVTYSDATKEVMTNIVKL